MSTFSRSFSQTNLQIRTVPVNISTDWINNIENTEIHSLIQGQLILIIK
jgi:hypothetical protein